MDTERMNKFERAQAKAPLREDRKNRFERHQEVVAEKRRDTTPLDERVKRNATQRTSWVGDGRNGGVRTTSGVLLDADTAKLKTASDASRQPKPPAPRALTDSTIFAIAAQWMQTHPDFYRSAFNGENFKNFMLTQVAAGKLDWSYESFTIAYDWLDKNGYFEHQYATPRRRGDAMRSAPKVFPPFVGDEERAAEEDRARIEQANRVAQEMERALSLPFAELKKQARAGMKSFSHEAVR